MMLGTKQNKISADHKAANIIGGLEGIVKLYFHGNNFL